MSERINHLEQTRDSMIGKQFEKFMDKLPFTKQLKEKDPFYGHVVSDYVESKND